MSLRGIVVMASGILPFVFLFWKLMAMGFGLSYRFKWVWAVDAASLSTIIALCATYSMGSALSARWRLGLLHLGRHLFRTLNPVHMLCIRIGQGKAQGTGTFQPF